MTKQVCFWSVDDDGVWSTACGREFTFNDDGYPHEHGFRYCYHCGSVLQPTSEAFKRAKQRDNERSKQHGRQTR